VYATDVLGRDGVQSLVPDGAADVVNRYPIAAMTDSMNAEAARAFADFVLSEQGQEVLARHGFGGP
jgi:molybdate transport system substrate-binding protein